MSETIENISRVMVNDIEGSHELGRKKYGVLLTSWWRKWRK
jgi:hypothetical protein